MPSTPLKVGELARRTGLTVRTLHHYDEIGLVKPSLHTEVGHRLYVAGDVARLQQVLSLRQLGFSLEEIGDCLDKPGFSPLEVIRLLVARLRQQIELQRGLCARLEALAASFSPAGEVSAEAFLQTIEVMNMIESYYTPEQLESMRQRGAALGQERLQQSQNSWAELIATYRAAMDSGTDPADPKAQALEKRRQALVDEFTGGDAAIGASLKRMWQEQGHALATQHGYDPKVLDYMRKVTEAAEKPK